MSIEPFKQKPLEWINKQGSSRAGEKEVSFELPKESDVIADSHTIQHSIEQLKKTPLPKVLGAVVDAVGDEGRRDLPPGTVIIAAGLISSTPLDLSRTLRALFHRAAEDI